MFATKLVAFSVLACVLWTCVLGECEREGVTYPTGPIANEDPCASCTCQASGDVSCAHYNCPMIPTACPDGSQPARPQGHCCPTCSQ